MAFSNNLFYVLAVQLKATLKLKMSAMVAFDTIALIYSLNLGKLKNLTKKWLFVN